MSAFKIYEINTVTWLRRLSQQAGCQITLADVPDEEWQRIANYHCQAVWLMGVWQRSPAAIEINRQDADFVAGVEQVLPDFEFDKDLIGSAYSIKQYSVDPRLGGDDGLAAAREHLKKHNLKLILDYVPNHVALDHEWATEHPEYFVQATQKELDADPDSYIKVDQHILARGRDPQYAAWSDVAQLNVFEPSLRQAVKDLVSGLAERCDGLRCDMAMLLINDIFSQTWRAHVEVPPQREFWAEVIDHVKRQYPDFVFMAEAYWDTQSQLVELGFDYCYDKGFYDYLVDNQPTKLRQQLASPLAPRLVRFLENHDEPRVAATLDWPRHQAAAVLINSLPGGLIYYEGQLKGYRIRTPVQLGRDPEQSVNAEIEAFYKRWLELNHHITAQTEDWQPLLVKAYNLNKKPSPNVLACSWRSEDKSYICVVNWGNQEVQVNAKLAIKQPQICFWTGQQQPLLKTHDTETSCQLKPWQAVVLVSADPVLPESE